MDIETCVNFEVAYLSVLMVWKSLLHIPNNFVLFQSGPLT